MKDSKSKIIDVSMNDMKATTNPHTLRSSGIGSCIVITLYDSQKRIGAMAHPMLADLPVSETVHINSNIKNPLRFVESAIDAMIEELENMGASKKRMEAKIVGGASMFKVFDKNPNSIGIHNAETAQKKLEKEGITITANDTGGNVGRSVSFNVTTGLVKVTTAI
jgi:chemotaxis protein CheD